MFSPKYLIRKNGRKHSLKTDLHRFFFPEEYLKTFDQLKKKQQHTTNFLINTGARINEAQHVLIEDVDLANKRMILKVTKSKARKGETKIGGGRPRIIPLSTEFTKYLQKFIRQKKLGDKNNFLLLNKASLNSALKKAANKAGIKDAYNFSAHNLRKTLEVWLMSLGVDGLKLTAHLGHDLKTAAQHYVSPDIFSYDDKSLMRKVIGDLYARQQL